MLNLAPFDKARSPGRISAPVHRASMRWALMDYGFRVVISSQFADIFRGAGKADSGGKVAQDDVELLWTIEEHPGMEITVNLQDRNIAAGTVLLPFTIDDYTAWQCSNSAI